MYGINNRLDLIEDDGFYLTVDENELDIFDTYNEDIPDWEPDRVIKPYSDLSIVHCDIETTGGIIKGSKDIDVENHSTKLIGVKNEKGKSLIIDAHNDERAAYRTFFKLLLEKKPDILNFYNGFFFDIPFIIGRCQILRIAHPFWVQPCSKNDIIKFHGGIETYRKKVNNYNILAKEVKKNEFPAIKIRRTAQVNGVPQIYTPIWLSIPTNNGGRKHCAIIDTYHETVAWDFVQRKLTSLRLKDVPYQMDLTKDEVIDLSYSEMLENIDNWDNGGKENLSKYLESDLNLTKILADKLLPPIYNKCLFLDWKFQSIAGSGNGTQWNSIISSFYDPEYLRSIETDTKRRFKGAYSAAYAGVYNCRNESGEDEYSIVEYDVLSLYPHMILIYGLISSKDVSSVLLKVLSFLLKARISNKDKMGYLKKIYGKNMTQEQKNEVSHYDGMQGVMKVLANSAYGYAGTSGIKFNDYHTASLVTGYGRAIFRHIYRLLAKLDDVTIISCDTDGFKLRLKRKNIQPYLEYLNANLPKNDNFAIKLKLEYTAKAIFVPPSDAIVNEDLVMDGELGEVRSGIKKNYIVVMDDDTVKANGKYRKRDRSVLQKTFQPNLIKILTLKGYMAAWGYYRGIINKMEDGTYPIENIQITRKVKKGNADKSLVERGIGKPGDVVTIHKSDVLSHYRGRKGQMLKTAKYKYVTDPDDVCWDGYIEEFRKQFEEVMQFVDKPIEFEKAELESLI